VNRSLSSACKRRRETGTSGRHRDTYKRATTVPIRRDSENHTNATYSALTEPSRIVQYRSIGGCGGKGLFSNGILVTAQPYLVEKAAAAFATEQLPARIRLPIKSGVTPQA